MAVTGIGSNYSNGYAGIYAAPAKETAGKEKTKETADAKREIEIAEKCDNQEYLRGVQKQVSHVTLETGSALNMKRDNKIGTVTINPKLLEKMQNDPEAEKKYTQLIKDIERAENTVNAYYNALGGCVERSSHWYIDENGEYCHFGYVYRDDKLNKKLRQEARENEEKLIEKNRKGAVEKRKKLKEMTAEKRMEIKETAESISEAEAAKEDRQAAKKQSAAKAAGANLDLLV